jgi:hypothetical protein
MTSPTTPTVLKKRLSRMWVFEVNTGSEETPSYTRVNGLNSAIMTLAVTEVDVSDNDSEGWMDNLAAARAWALALQGWDGYTGPNNAQVEDPGQAALRAKGLLTGPEAYADIRFYRSDTLKGFSGRVTPNLAQLGGATNAAEAFNVNCNGSGKPTPIDLNS